MKLTENDKVKIDNMRKSGFGYRKIAGFLGLSKDAVKYYIQKNNCKINSEITGITLKDICPNCCAPLIQTPHKRKKIYCSDKCRMQAWHKANYRSKGETIIESDVDAVFLPGKIHGYEDILYIIYFVAESNEKKGAWEIEIIDAKRILKVYKASNGDAEAFFEMLPDWFHGEWRYCNDGTDEAKTMRKNYGKADFIVGRDGDIRDEMMFLVKWAQSRN